MEFDRPKKIGMHFDIAPLIDIVFMLLLFFMLTSNFVTDSGIELNLPKSTTAELKKKSKPIVIYINQDEQIFLEKEQFNLPELQKLLTGKLKNRQLKKVVLKADKTVPMGLVVNVMDVARQAEGEDLVISTEKVESVSSDGKE